MDKINLQSIQLSNTFRCVTSSITLMFKNKLNDRLAYNELPMAQYGLLGSALATYGPLEIMRIWDPGTLRLCDSGTNGTLVPMC